MLPIHYAKSTRRINGRKAYDVVKPKVSIKTAPSNKVSNRDNNMNL